MSGSKGSKSTTSTVSVPKYLDTELQNGVAQSRDLYDQGAPAYYPGQTVAGFTPTQTAAQNATIARATDGSPLVNDAQTLADNTINGQYLNDNPYLDQLMQTYGAKANATANSTFNKSGRLGSGANVATAGQAISDATLPYLFQNYQNERGLQNSAMGQAPTLANQDYKDLSALSAVGDAQQTQNQANINADMTKYNYNAEAPSNWLDQYLSRINGSGANKLTTTNQTTSQSSGLGSTIGAGLALGSMFVPGGQFAGLGSSIGGGLSSALGGLGNQSIGGLMSSSATGPYLPYGLCDIRVKENIHHIGYENNFPMYLFNYIGNDKKYIGPMAQDIEKVMPNAVREFNGVKHVNLDMAGVSLKEAN